VDGSYCTAAGAEAMRHSYWCTLSTRFALRRFGGDASAFKLPVGRGSGWGAARGVCRRERMRHCSCTQSPRYDRSDPPPASGSGAQCRGGGARRPDVRWAWAAGECAREQGCTVGVEGGTFLWRPRNDHLAPAARSGGKTSHAGKTVFCNGGLMVMVRDHHKA